MDILDSLLYILIAVALYFYTSLSKKKKAAAPVQTEDQTHTLHNMHQQVVPSSWNQSDFQETDLEDMDDSMEKIHEKEEDYNTAKSAPVQMTNNQENKEVEKTEKKTSPKKKKQDFDLRKAIIYNSILERKKF